MRTPSGVVAALAWIAPAILGAAPCAAATSPHSLPGFAYVSPVPESELHRRHTNIILRPGGTVDPASLGPTTVTATGSLSGEHAGALRLSDDGMTILFRPHVPFSYEESVVCAVAPGIRATSGGELPGAMFTFHTAPALGVASFDATVGGLADRLGVSMDEPPATAWAREPARSPGTVFDTIPGLPYTMSVTGATAPGDLFVADVRFDNEAYRTHLMILRNDGAPVFHRYLGRNGLDFKVQPNRRLTYYDGSTDTFYALDANYAVVDSFRTGNGYPLDFHELVILPNGHALLMSYDSQPVDMSQVVEGGDTGATVVGLVIQELDLEKDVVFQWRSWDHFQITDGVRSLTTARVDFAHGNSIEQDADGHLIISSRHMDEITKLSRETGEILWRLGGKNNQFTFVNDPVGFSQQHSARRLANGNLLLFDNGNFHSPSRSRAVEYALDEANRTATQVWEYRDTPDLYGSAMGSVQRLPNGNTLICWGSTNPTATEVTPEGVKVAELNFPPGTYSYRAFRFEWPPVVTAEARSEQPIDVEKKDQYVTVLLSSDEFQLGEVDYTSLRLAGVVSPASFSVPIAEATAIPRSRRHGTTLLPEETLEAEVHFPVEPLLPYLTGGSQKLSLTGKLTSGEPLTGSVSVSVSGEREVRSRVVSPVGAFPIQLAVRATGVPRAVAFEAFDVQGRRVAQWTSVSDASGIVAWDGRGKDGARLRSGIYFVGTKGSALKERTRVVLVK